MSAIDQFVGSTVVDFPATGGQAVTPSDTVDLTNVSRALWVGVTGDVTVIMKDGQTLTYPAVPVGWMPIRVSRVKASLTTANGIVAVW
jgi:hypothetical protein